jgi:hypothetical protein
MVRSGLLSSSPTERRWSESSHSDLTLLEASQLIPPQIQIQPTSAPPNVATFSNGAPNSSNKSSDSTKGKSKASDAKSPPVNDSWAIVTSEFHEPSRFETKN